MVPRLVHAVLNRESFEKGARMATVTAQESAPFRTRPGEGLFVIGIGLEPLGGSIGWSYEARRFRLGVLAQGAGENGSFLGIDGAWVPHDGNVSPYLGAGLGVVDGGDDASLGRSSRSVSSSSGCTACGSWPAWGRSCRSSRVRAAIG